jgi:hypothetical protein
MDFDGGFSTFDKEAVREAFNVSLGERGETIGDE